MSSTPQNFPFAVEKLEERWTPTTIQTAFGLYPRHGGSRSSEISLNLPLPNLGWTFALSLTLKKAEARKYQSQKSSKSHNWIPVTFSFRQHGNTGCWRDTSMRAELSFAVEQCDCRAASEGSTPDDNVRSDPTPLTTMEIVLANTPSARVKLTTPPTLSFQSTKVWLTVTIMDCPFANGLFEAASGQINEAEAQAQLVRKSGDRLLNRSLATGKISDVKFFTCSTRLASGNTGKLFQTYASLSLVEEHVNLSSAKLGEEWTSALAALNRLDDGNAKHVWEISCPSDCEYELDSDFEDEDEASSPVERCASLPTRERALVSTEEDGIEGSSSSFSSLQLDGVSDLDSIGNHPEEVIKGPGEPSHPFLAVAADSERTIFVKFAAPRTWYAFLWYCYTGHLEFSKLKSQIEPGARRLPAAHLQDGPLSCSPKSMYRLADLVDNKALKDRALEGIKERMSGVNVLDEIFSVFTSKYPEVRDAQLEVLMECYRLPRVKKEFLRMMSKFNSMPHAEPALSAFYDGLAALKSDRPAQSCGNVARDHTAPSHSPFWD